ncbi:MAG: hypothetical protein IJZ16_04660 [Clostridia bacterium]|nr:hypothetical protein [Clostridia bacterium]
MQNEIREDMLKVKRMVSEVEIIIGKREGESELVNKLIDAQNLLTYCMSRLENAFVPPCKVGETLYLVQVDYKGNYSMTPIVVGSKITMLSILRAYEEKTIVYMSTDKDQAEQKLNEMRIDNE